MYRAFFGFREQPFNLTPDPKFLYLNASYREALAALKYGVTERKGFVSLIGEAGTGKTTLLRRLLADLGPGIRSVLVLNPAVTFDELLTFILTDLGRTPAPGTAKLDLIQTLNAELLDTLAQGGNVVVLIDEAQDLDMGVLEELRLLSNLETAKEKILQIVLAGQPELDAMLARPELRQLRQRIAVPARLKPLARREIGAYVAVRLHAAGGDGALFTQPALYRLWRFARGVPRLVNVACDNALVAAYAAQAKRVGWNEVGEGVRDLRPVKVPAPAPVGIRVGALATAVVAGAVLGVSAVRYAGLPLIPSAEVSPSELHAKKSERELEGGAGGKTGEAGSAEVAASAGSGAASASQAVGAGTEAAAEPGPHVAGAPAAAHVAEGSAAAHVGEGPAAAHVAEGSAAAHVGEGPAAAHVAEGSAAAHVAEGPAAANQVGEPSAAHVASAHEGAPAGADADTLLDAVPASGHDATQAAPSDGARATAREGGAPERAIAPAPAQAPVGEQIASAESGPEIPGFATVQVVAGDDVTHIARRHYGYDSPELLQAIKRANPTLVNLDLVLIGQTLVLPPDEASPAAVDSGADSSGTAASPSTDSAN